MKTKTQSCGRTHVELRYNKKRFICFMLSIGAKSQNFVLHTIAVENDLQFFRLRSRLHMVFVTKYTQPPMIETIYWAKTHKVLQKLMLKVMLSTSICPKIKRRSFDDDDDDTDSTAITITIDTSDNCTFGLCFVDIHRCFGHDV